MSEKNTTNKIKLAVISLILWLFVSVQAVNSQETPWVLDETNDLTKETLEYISDLNENKFTKYDIKPQLAIEILNKLPKNYSDIDSYRNERFKELGVGEKENDSGVLVVISIDERVMGIETGYGTESIIRDIEANNIINGDMKHYMADYVDNKNPQSLNQSVLSATNEIEDLLEKANSGVLYEERDAKQEELANKSKTMQNATTILALTIASLLIVKKLRNRINTKKIEKTKEQLTEYFYNHYNNLDSAVKSEITKEEFMHQLNVNFPKLIKNYAPNNTIDELISNKEDLIVVIRTYNYLEKINNEKEIYPDKRMYINSTNKYKKNIKNDNNYNIKKHIEYITNLYQKRLNNIVIYSEQLKDITNYEVNSYKNQADGYDSNLFCANNVYKKLIDKYNLNKEGAINGDAQLLDKSYVKKDIQEIVYKIILDNTISNEFKNETYGYGNNKAFKALIISSMVGSLAYLSKDKLINHINKELLIYKKKEALKERERIRRMERRLQEERRRKAMTANRSSGSSGGSFGSGFGGGSSGGGGASGGF